MKYVSLDLETTGLDAKTCQILSLGLVLEDTKVEKPIEDLPKLHVILLHDFIQGEPFALNMNKNIIESIVKYQKAKTWEERDEISKKMNARFILPDQLTNEVLHFLITNGVFGSSLNVAGKNFAGFDRPFLDLQYGWNENIKIGHRVIDPAPLFVNWEEDEKLPDFQTCMTRANVLGDVTHDALQDAIDVVRILRTTYKK